MLFFSYFSLILSNKDVPTSSHKEVIEWFKNITNKQKHKFIVFDIKDFYPTISKDLLTKCLKLAEEKVQISNDNKKLYIMQESLYCLMKKIRG